jgi:hypothetical protein
LLFHISGPFDSRATPVRLSEGESQPQLAFELPGWQLTLIPGEESFQCRDFAALVHATPRELPIEEDERERLQWRLFVLLGFLAGKEIGMQPVCGLDGRGEVCWASFAPPRIQYGKAAVNWSMPQLHEVALPELADGFAAIEEDKVMEVIVDRAIGYLLAAGDNGVLDVRLPIACAGIELLASAVIHRQPELSKQKREENLSAGEEARLLLEWAGLPTSLALSQPHLEQRLEKRRKEGQKDWAGPEVLFDLRNRFLHPPRSMEDPEWPDTEELFEGWQLGTWYLELALLRILGYEGEYWSRLRLGRSAFDLEPVPWAK